MTLQNVTATVFGSQDWKSRWSTGLLAILTLAFIAVLHDYAVKDRMLLNCYFVGVAAAVYVLARHRAMALMEFVIFAAVARTLLGVYLAAKPGIADPILAGAADVMFWFVLLYMGWRVAAEVYRFQAEEIQQRVKQDVEKKISADRGAALAKTSREIHRSLVTVRTLADALLNDADRPFDSTQQDSLDDIDHCVSHLMILVDNLL
ncbi:MAG: hypothetical protein JW888_15455, partial [Pirellulales bacterium]|nr:hypothetical protein [Pirellulales bacterium]